MTKLPKVHTTHIQERESITRLQAILPPELFILRSEDGGDYGVDKIIEVVSNNEATNIRCHVQLKSIRTRLIRAQGLKFKIKIKTLNYLRNSQNSIYVIYCVENDEFYWDWVGSINADKNEAGQKLKENYKSITHEFKSKLDSDGIIALHQQLIERNNRFKNFMLAPKAIALLSDISNFKSTITELNGLFSEGKYETVIAIGKEQQSKAPEILSLIALSHYRLRNYIEALRAIVDAEKCSDSIDVIKTKSIILCEMGLSQHIEGPLQEAWELYSRLPKDNWTWMDYYNFGNMDSGLKRYIEAEENYRAAIALDDGIAEIWKNLGDLYRQQNRREEELSCLDQALSLNENLVEALVSKAISISRYQSQFTEAIELLTRALSAAQSQNYDCSSIYYWLSAFHSKIGLHDAALNDIQTGLTYYPGNHYLEMAKIEVLSQAAANGQVYASKAISELKRQISENPQNSRLKIDLIRILSGIPNESTDSDLIQDCFRSFGITFDDDLLSSIAYQDVINFFDNLNQLRQYRASYSFSAMMFDVFDISIAQEKRISAYVDLLFVRFLTAMSSSVDDEQALNAMEDHSEKFLEVNNYCARVLVSDLAGNENVDIKTERISNLILTIPEVLLRELSRQFGWGLQFRGLDSEVADSHLKMSKFTGNWFQLSIEPILSGCNHGLKLFREA